MIKGSVFYGKEVNSVIDLAEDCFGVGYILDVINDIVLDYDLEYKIEIPYFEMFNITANDSYWNWLTRLRTR